eukprot:6196396-Pleurochrysis_carterae.AAC.1
MALSRAQHARCWYSPIATQPSGGWDTPRLSTSAALGRVGAQRRGGGDEARPRAHPRGSDAGDHGQAGASSLLTARRSRGNGEHEWRAAPTNSSLHDELSSRGVSGKKVVTTVPDLRSTGVCISTAFIWCSSLTEFELNRFEKAGCTSTFLRCGESCSRPCTRMLVDRFPDEYPLMGILLRVQLDILTGASMSSPVQYPIGSTGGLGVLRTTYLCLGLAKEAWGEADRAEVRRGSGLRRASERLSHAFSCVCVCECACERACECACACACARSCCIVAGGGRRGWRAAGRGTFDALEQLDGARGAHGRQRRRQIAHLQVRHARIQS